MPDPTEPGSGDTLERMLAAEEAAIRDDGFSQRVMEKAGLRTSVRRATIYGAGMLGFGFAVGGAMELAPYVPALPKITGWYERANAALTVDGLRTAAESGGLGFAVMGVALAAALISMVAVAVQGR